MLLLFRRFLGSAVFISFSVLQLTLFACGSVVDSEAPLKQRPNYAHDPELESILQSYLSDAIAAGAPVPLQFQKELLQLEWADDLGTDGNVKVLGRCERFNEGSFDPLQRFRTVRILKANSDGLVGSLPLTAVRLKTIVYHELGHCLHDFKGHLPESSQQIMSVTLANIYEFEFAAALKDHFQHMKQRK